MSVRSVCAGALGATAAIHAAAVREHLHEWRAAGLFFIALAAIEAVFAAFVLVSDRRSVLLTGVGLSVASAALWLVSRTVGLPVGPEAFSPEAIAGPDVASTTLEVLTAALLLLAVRPRRELADAPLDVHP